MIGLIIVGIFIFLELYDIHCDLKEINNTLKKINDTLDTFE